jgi:hypothetical protein
VTPTQVKQQITDIISLLVKEGLCDHQRYPSLTVVGGISKIGISEGPDLSVSLKDISYTDIYDELRKAEAYHLRMIDGALIQMLYTFDRRAIRTHRLSMFPSPNLEMYETIAEQYDEDELYSDIVGEFSVKVPIRFDFSADNTRHVDVDHPKSHLTLGQYEWCRIPLDRPLTPRRFMRFILRNFYGPGYSSVNMDVPALNENFEETISPNERRILNIAC